MPSNISVSTPVQSVAITENSYNVSVVGDTATVSVSTTTPQVSVVESTSTFTINTVANKADIGLGNVDNTSDADKPVSTATQTALDAKLNKSGGIMSGSLTLAADPTQNLQAATKGYVDGQVNAVPVINSTDDVAEGSINLYYTNARANTDFDTRLATKSTTNVAEGTNQYFTTARARSSVSGTGSIAYNSTTGVISYTGGSNPTTTDELPEGSTNKYYTTARANSDFDTRLATKTTTNLNEGTNLYYTTARANSDFDIRLATKSTTNLAEGTNLYYTTARSNTDFDGRLATKSTSNLAEGTNLYYTSARANSDFDTRLATKTTDNLSQGTTNKYYSDTLARNAVSAGTGISYNNTTGAIAVDTSTIATRSYADSAAASAAAAVVDAAPATLDTLNELAAALGDDPNFATTISTSLGNKLNTGDFNSTADGWLAGKTTTNVAEGTNLYYTDTRARGAISATGSLSYNSTTGVISYTTPTSDGITEGSTNLYYTSARANADFDTRLATKTTTNLAEGTNLYYTNGRFNTQFATKSTTDLAEGTNLYYTDSRFDTRLATKTTTNLAEGTNQYFTNARARSAVANGVDLAINGSNEVYVKSLRNATRVYGGMEASTNVNYVFPPQVLSTITDNNGYSAASSFPAGTTGFGANANFTHYYGDTLAGVNTAPAFNFRNANGNSSTGDVIPFTGLTSVDPSATLSGNVMGTLNYNGYGTTGFTNDIATTYQGGGINSLSSMQLQSYPTENFSDSVLTLTSTNVSNTVASSFRATMTSTSVVGTKGQIQYSGTAGSVGQAVRVTGTLTGNATGIVSGQTYYMIVYSNNGTNSFATLSATPGGVPITTSGTTLTGLTLTRCSVSFTTTGLTNVPFGRGALVTVSGITNITDGTYPVWGTPTTTTFSIGVPHTVAPTMAGAQTFSCRTAYMGSGLRIRAFPTATPATLQNRLELLDIAPGATTIRTNSLTLNTGAYGNTGVGITGNNIIYNRVFGQFAYSTTITPAAANTAAVFPLGTADDSNIATVGSTSRLIPGAVGKYNLQFSIQTSNSDNGADHIAYIWLRKNGVDVVGSTGRVYVTKGNASIVGWNYLISSANTTDYWEIAYAVDDLNVTFPFYAATAFAPSTASLITTLTPVGA